MQKRARKSLTPAAQTPTAKRLKQTTLITPKIGFKAGKYYGSDVYKFTLHCENPITTKENLIAYHFLRQVMNGVLVFEDMVTSAPAPSEEMYTVKELVGDLARRIEETTDREIDKDLYTKLVKADILTEDIMEEIAENLKSCFHVFTFNSEFDLTNRYNDRTIVSEMKKWYKKTKDDHPTLIAFVIRNTFKFILWRVEFDMPSKLITFYEYVHEETEEAGDTLHKRVWKKIIKSDDPTIGYSYETNNYDNTKYYMFNMQEETVE